MSMPNDPQPPGPSAGPAPSTSTQEIPVVPPAATSVQQLPPPSAPVPPAAAPAAAPPVSAPHGQRETGPVGFVPGLTASPAPAAPPPTGAWPETLEDETATAPPPVERTPRDRRLLAAAGLVLASLALLQLGLALEFGAESFWSALPLWSAFATVCVVLGFTAVAELVPGGRRPAGPGWPVAAAGLMGLAVFWVLVVLPNADSDRGFLHTAALGALGGALWLTAGRRSG